MDSLEALKADKDKLQRQLKAINDAITGLEAASTGKRRGRKRHLSAAARKALSEAGKKRWASKKRAEAKS